MAAVIAVECLKMGEESAWWTKMEVICQRECATSTNSQDEASKITVKIKGESSFPLT